MIIGQGFERGAVPEAGVQPLAVVVNLDILHDSEPRAGTGIKSMVAIHLVFQRGEE